VRVADDLVERDFRPAAPNLLWIADMTYLRTWEGWLYLAAVQDAFSRRIVGWSMAESIALVLEDQGDEGREEVAQLQAA
jgi:putative transposase